MEEPLKIFIQRGHGYNQFGTYVNINELSNVHWDNVSGGVYRRQSGYSLYAYVDYHDYKDQVNCSGRHDYGYNDMKVLIPKVSRDDSTYPAYKLLCKMAGEKPKAISTRPPKMPPCTKRILSYLKSGTKTRGELRELLYADKYQVQTIRGALRTLIAQKKIECYGSPYSKNQLIKLH